MMDDISIDEFKERIDASDLENIFDVREEWEYEEFNIGAELLPLYNIPQRISELEPLKTSEIIVFCQSGKRSGQAKKYLISQGFTAVRSVKGGLNALKHLS